MCAKYRRASLVVFCFSVNIRKLAIAVSNEGSFEAVLYSPALSFDYKILKPSINKYQLIPCTTI